MAKKSQYKQKLEYNNNYNRNNYRSFSVRFNNKVEKTVIAWLEAKESVKGYLCELILADMEKNGKKTASKKPTKKATVKTEKKLAKKTTPTKKVAKPVAKKTVAKPAAKKVTKKTVAKPVTTKKTTKAPVTKKAAKPAKKTTKKK